MHQFDTASIKEVQTILNTSGNIQEIRLLDFSEDALNHLYQLLQSSNRNLKISGNFSQEWQLKFQLLNPQHASTFPATSQNSLPSKRATPSATQQNVDNTHPNPPTKKSRITSLETKDEVITTKTAQNAAAEIAPGLFDLGMWSTIKTEGAPKKKVDALKECEC